MATYYIDSNRGNDNNAGTSSAAPWQSLSKITSVTATAGDEFLLASDSEFNLSARILINSGLGWSSAIGKPIRFGVYYPAGQNTSRPIIRKRQNIAAGSWTYSAPNNAWTFTAANTISSYAYVKCGNAWATRTDNALPLDSVDGRWSNSGSTLYVYAPAGTNPTDYYGSVTFGGDSSDSAFVVSSPGSAAAFVFSGWRFEEVGSGIYVFNSTGNRQIRIDDMQSDSTGAVFYALTQTAGALDLEVSRLVARNSGTTFVSANAASGVGISRWVVRDCLLEDCNFGFPQGAIYSQVREGGAIFHNTIRRARFGVPGKQSDGAAIYLETNSANTVVNGNLIQDCYLAFQDNSGRPQRIVGNVVERVYAVARISDTTSTGTCNFVFRNNTCIKTGAPIAAQAGSVAGIGLWAVAAMTSTGFDIQNNIFQTDTGGAPAIELPTSASGTIAYNNVVGYSATAENSSGGASPITPTNTTAVDPQLRGDYVPQASAVRTGGTYLAGLDYYGKEFQPSAMPIGAVQPQEARTLVDRTLAGRRAIAG